MTSQWSLHVLSRRNRSPAPWKKNGKLCTCNHGATRAILGQFRTFTLTAFVYLSLILFHNDLIEIYTPISVNAASWMTWKALYSPQLRIGLRWASHVFVVCFVLLFVFPYPLIYLYVTKYFLQTCLNDTWQTQGTSVLVLILCQLLKKTPCMLAHL